MSASSPEIALLVDDDWRVLVATQETLEKAHYRVITRDRVSGVINTIQREKPAVVLVEPDMSGVSGEGLIRILTQPDRKHRPLVLLHSALPFDALYERANSCGADGYIQKNEPAGRLISQINHWAVRARVGASAMKMRAAEAATPEPPDEEPASRTSRVGTPATITVPTKPVVLFVDDDPVMLKSYRRDFANDDFECDFAQTGESALALLHSSSPPDVVVCDLLMPGVSGSELYEKALGLHASWRKRFVFTTGFGNVRHISAFVASVEARVLKKPLNKPELREAIRYAALTARLFTSRATAPIPMVRPVRAG
ncbi:MAG TPA: response regulator [Polyangiaceae bacterium]